MIIILICLMILKQCGLYLLTPLPPSNAMVLPYDDIYLSQHGLRLGLVAWQHHANTWTNVDLSLMRFSGIHLRAISQQVPKLLLSKITMIIYVGPGCEAAIHYPDNKDHGANMGPICGRQVPGGPRVDPINFVNWVHECILNQRVVCTLCRSNMTPKS